MTATLVHLDEQLPAVKMPPTPQEEGVTLLNEFVTHFDDCATALRREKNYTTAASYSKLATEFRIATRKDNPMTELHQLLRDLSWMAHEVREALDLYAYATEPKKKG